MERVGWRDIVLGVRNPIGNSSRVYIELGVQYTANVVSVLHCTPHEDTLV